MKQIILSILFLQTVCYAQAGFANDSLKNDSTYISIPGTSISLFLPAGFSKANKFPGIKHPESGAFIMVSNLNSTYRQVKAGFTSQGFKSQGMELLESSELNLETGKGLLFKASKKNGNIIFNKWILILKNDSSSIMINGTFPKSFDSDIAAEVLDCILSAQIDNKRVIKYEEAVNFEVNVEYTKLKFAKYFAGTLIFTVDGNFPAKSKDKTSFKIGSSLGIVEIKNPRDFAIESLKKLPFTFNKNIEINPIKIDGLSGYEIIAYSTDKKSGFRQLIYQLILYSGNSYYILLGTAYDDYENNLSLFIDVSSSFKQRKGIKKEE